MNESKPVDHPLLGALVHVLLILFVLGMALANHRESFFEDFPAQENKDETLCTAQGYYGTRGVDGGCHIGGTR